MFSLRRAAQVFLVAGALAAAGTAVLTAQRDQTREAAGGAVMASTGDAPAGRAGGLAILEGDSVPDFIISPSSQSIATRILSGATGAELGAGFPFGPAFGGGVRMAAGDLSGDGVADLVMGMGPGGGLVSLLNGATLALVGSGYPFGPAFGGGVSLAVGDVNGDGSNDIVTGQASGGGAVTVFNGLNYSVILAVTPFGPGYTGGVNVATGDVDGDGRADLIIGQASGGVVSLVSAATGAVTATAAPYGAVNGVFVAAADVNGDGRAEVIAAPGSGSGQVLVYDLRTLTLLAAFSPYPATFGGGVRVAATDVTGDGRADILTVPGPGIAPTLLVFDGATFANIRSYAAFPASFTSGAFIAAAAAADIRFTSPAAATVTAGTAASLAIRAVGSPAVTGLLVSGTLPAGMTFTDNGGGSGTLAGTPSASSGGTYTLTFTASNSSSSPRTQTFTLTVNQAPAISSAAATTFNIGAAGSFTVTSTGFPTASIGLSGALPAGMTFTANSNGTGTLAGTPAAGTSGTYPLTLTASNGVGAAATQNFVLTVQAVPIITSANATSFTTSTPGTFTVTTTASPAVTGMSASGALPSGVTFTYNGNGTATLAGTPGAATGGTYALTLSSVNGGGTGTQSFTLTVQQPAAITSGASTTFLQGTPGSFAVTATGFPAPTLTVTGALPAGVTFADNGNGAGTLAGTPTAGGSYPVTLRATNGVGAQATQSFVLTVNAAPAFTSAASTSFTTATAGSFTITTSGTPAATISLTGALPTGVTFTNNGNGTATLAGTPAAATGNTYAVTLSATNGIGSPASQNFVLTVRQAPAITSANTTSFSENQAGTFTVTTTGFPSATVSATGALPTGMTLTPNGNGTATLAGTPATGTQGAYPLTISASNGVGSPATQNFTLNVNGCAAITLSPAAGALPAGTYNTAYTQTFTATGGSGHAFSVTAGSLPAGLTLANGGALTGSPTTGTFNFTVSATIAGGCAGSSAYSLTVAPNAQNESFSNAVGNTQLSVGAGTPATPAVALAGTVLSNDTGPGSLTVGPANIASINGGQVALGTNGTFLYTPPLGFAGPSDTFTYTLTDGNGATDTAVVTINMSGVVWYVNAAAGAGDGRSHSPFNTMTAAAAAAQTAQIIYVHPGSPAGATVLKANQTLRGAGETFVLNGLTIAAGATPTLQGSITLANGVAVRALNVNAGANPAVSGTGLTGTESLTNVTISGGSSGIDLTNLAGTFSTSGGAISGITPGAAVAISGGTGTVSIGSSISSSAGRSVDVQSRTAGTVTFAGAITDTASGVRLLNNTGSTIAFTGGLALDTGVNAAFTATGGGTVTATQNNTTILNTVTTTDGVALQVVNTAIGSAGLTFRSITAGTATSSAGNGIVLDNTGTAVGNSGLTVQGNGTVTAYSGGTIRRKTGADGSTTAGNGIYLSSTKNPTFNWMRLFDFDNSAILGRNVAGFTLADSVIEGTSGTSASALEGPIVFGAPNPSGTNGLIGAGAISNTIIQGGVEHNVEVYNQSGTMSLQISGTSPVACQVMNNSTTTGGDGLRVVTEGTASATVTVDRCRFRDNRSAGTRGLVTGDASLTFTATDSQWVRGGDAVLLSNGGNALLTATVHNGLFTDIPGSHVQVGQVPFDATATSLLRATITNNTAYQNATVVPTVHAYGARLSSTVGQVSRARLLFSGNYIEGDGSLNHLVVETPDAGTTPEVDVTLTSNRTDVINATSGLRGIVVSGSLSGAATNICAAVKNNLVLYPPDDTNYPPTAVNSIRVTQGGGTTVRLERGTEVLASSAATVLQNNNNLGPVNSLPTVVNGAVLVIENNTCLLPSAP